MMNTRPEPAEPMLEITGLSHAYGNLPVVRGLSFRLSRGTIACLLGPSGCGKTTVLRCIAGFEQFGAGEIRLGGRLVSSTTVQVPPEQRRIGMVFQDYALFPHLNVARNVAFGLRELARDEQQQRVAECLAAVGLAGQGGKYPHELSGGQQQRVAIARAIATRPDLLLLDEPFSNLDVDLRERLSLELREIIKRFGITAVLVTHDQQEAFAIGDEVGIMHEGTIQQWDSAYNLYHRPANRFVADFIGQGVFLPGTVISTREVDIELGSLRVETPLACARGCDECGKGCRLEVLLRPDDVVHDDSSALTAEVLAKAFRGANILYTLRLASGSRILALVPSHHNHAIGEMIGIRLAVDHVVTFPPLAATAVEVSLRRVASL